MQRILLPGLCLVLLVSAQDRGSRRFTPSPYMFGQDFAFRPTLRPKQTLRIGALRTHRRRTTTPSPLFSAEDIKPNREYGISESRRRSTTTVPYFEAERVNEIGGGDGGKRTFQRSTPLRSKEIQLAEESRTSSRRRRPDRLQSTQAKTLTTEQSRRITTIPKLPEPASTNATETAATLSQPTTTSPLSGGTAATILIPGVTQTAAAASDGTGADAAVAGKTSRRFTRLRGSARRRKLKKVKKIRMVINPGDRIHQDKGRAGNTAETLSSVGTSGPPSRRRKGSGSRSSAAEVGPIRITRRKKILRGGQRGAASRVQNDADDTLVSTRLMGKRRNSLSPSISAVGPEDKSHRVGAPDDNRSSSTAPESSGLQSSDSSSTTAFSVKEMGGSPRGFILGTASIGNDLLPGGKADAVRPSLFPNRHRLGGRGPSRVRTRILPTRRGSEQLEDVYSRRQQSSNGQDFSRRRLSGDATRNTVQPPELTVSALRTPSSVDGPSPAPPQAPLVINSDGGVSTVQTLETGGFSIRNDISVGKPIPTLSPQTFSFGQTPEIGDTTESTSSSDDPGSFTARTPFGSISFGSAAKLPPSVSLRPASGTFIPTTSRPLTATHSSLFLGQNGFGSSADHGRFIPFTFGSVFDQTGRLGDGSASFGFGTSRDQKVGSGTHVIGSRSSVRESARPQLSLGSPRTFTTETDSAFGFGSEPALGATSNRAQSFSRGPTFLTTARRPLSRPAIFSPPAQISDKRIVQFLPTAGSPPPSVQTTTALRPRQPTLLPTVLRPHTTSGPRTSVTAFHPHFGRRTSSLPASAGSSGDDLTTEGTTSAPGVTNSTLFNRVVERVHHRPAEVVQNGLRGTRGFRFSQRGDVVVESTQLGGFDSRPPTFHEEIITNDPMFKTSDIRPGFTCEGRPYGYYADEMNDCKIFHICQPVYASEETVLYTRYSFFCGDSTVFDQSMLSCLHVKDAVPCSETGDWLFRNSEFGSREAEQPQQDTRLA